MLAAALRPSDLPVRSCRYRCEDLERVKGIEPSSSAWKAVALPLSYTRTRSSLHTKDRRPAIANRLARRRASTIKRLRRACLRLTSRSADRAKAGGGGRTRTYEGVSQRIYSPPPSIANTREFPLMSQLCCSARFAVSDNDLCSPAGKSSSSSPPQRRLRRGKLGAVIAAGE